MGFIWIGDTSWEPTAKKDSKKSHYLWGGVKEAVGIRPVWAGIFPDSLWWFGYSYVFRCNALGNFCLSGYSSEWWFS